MSLRNELLAMDSALAREVVIGSLARSTIESSNTDDADRYGERLSEYPALMAMVHTVMHEVDADLSDNHLGFDIEPTGYSEGLVHGVVTVLNMLAEYVEVAELKAITDL